MNIIRQQSVSRSVRISEAHVPQYSPYTPFPNRTFYRFLADAVVTHVNILNAPEAAHSGHILHMLTSIHRVIKPVYYQLAFRERLQQQYTTEHTMVTVGGVERNIVDILIVEQFRAYTVRDVEHISETQSRQLTTGVLHMLHWFIHHQVLDTVLHAVAAQLNALNDPYMSYRTAAVLIQLFFLTTAHRAIYLTEYDRDIPWAWQEPLIAFRTAELYTDSTPLLAIYDSIQALWEPGS